MFVYTDKALTLWTKYMHVVHKIIRFSNFLGTYMLRHFLNWFRNGFCHVISISNGLLTIHFLKQQFKIQVTTISCNTRTVMKFISGIVLPQYCLNGKVIWCWFIMIFLFTKRTNPSKALGHFECSHSVHVGSHNWDSIVGLSRVTERERPTQVNL